MRILREIALHFSRKRAVTPIIVRLRLKVLQGKLSVGCTSLSKLQRGCYSAFDIYVKLSQCPQIPYPEGILEIFP